MVINWYILAADVRARRVSSPRVIVHLKTRLAALSAERTDRGSTAPRAPTAARGPGRVDAALSAATADAAANARGAPAPPRPPSALGPAGPDAGGVASSSFAFARGPSSRRFVGPASRRAAFASSSARHASYTCVTWCCTTAMAAAAAAMRKTTPHIRARGVRVGRAR